MYADSTAVLGPLATYAEPHSYDLCDRHSARLTAPLGWEILRLELSAPAGPTPDDLEALADAVREAGRPAADAAHAGNQAGAPPAGAASSGGGTGAGPSHGRRGHLRVLQPPPS